jgi:hypothetical protein
MQGSCSALRSASLNWFVAIAGLGCAAIAPLDDIDNGKGGARSENDDADAGVRGGKRPASDEDAGVDSGCMPAPGADCDPIAQCGCEDRETCQAATGQRARCKAATAAVAAREGEPCDRDRVCAKGVVCPLTGLCAPSCVNGADCPSGSCEQLLDPGGGPLPESGRVCVRSCDPVSSDGCSSGSTCVPSTDLTRQKVAVCHRIQADERVASPGQVGDDCARHSDCDRGRGCLSTSTDLSGQCTLWCRGAFDCPTQLPTCQMLDWYYSAEGDPIGQCVPEQTETTGDVCTVPDDPATWSGGTVWTLEDLSACLSACSSLENACVIAMCTRGAEFVTCMGTTLEACAGSLDGACRPEYTTAVCCQRQQCEGAADVDACNQMFCSEALSTWSMCAGNDQMCAEVATMTCVELAAE